jgi:hypothetical protein
MLPPWGGVWDDHFNIHSWIRLVLRQYNKYSEDRIDIANLLEKFSSELNQQENYMLALSLGVNGSKDEQIKIGAKWKNQLVNINTRKPLKSFDNEAIFRTVELAGEKLGLAAHRVKFPLRKEKYFKYTSDIEDLCINKDSMREKITNYVAELTEV